MLLLKNKAKSLDKISKDIFQKITKKLISKFKKIFNFLKAIKNRQYLISHPDPSEPSGHVLKSSTDTSGRVRPDNLININIKFIKKMI